MEYESNMHIRAMTDVFKNDADINERPVIGIMTQTIEEEMKADPRFKGYNSYMMAAYAQFMESAGARVVPIIVNDTIEANLEKIEKLNGVLFPGGGGDYEFLGRQIYNRIKEINDNGTYYPLWGTCLGHEMLSIYASDEGDSVLDRYGAHSVSLSLKFLKDPKTTKMYQWLGDSAYLFEDHNITYNSHSFSISPEKFKTDKGIADIFEILSLSYTADGKEFVSSMEGKKYPFFGTQFHPEKESQTWLDNAGVDHSWLSVNLNRHFADYFIYLARHNTNSIGNFTEGQKFVIENYNVINTDGYFGSVYVFE
jgi:gamma-glutamyl hydrolase